MTFSLTSPAFTQDGPIPARHTCDGEDVSPPLAWSGTPPGARSFVLVVDDPDAPDPAAPRTTWVHWVLYDIPGDARGIEEGSLPEGAREGRNDWMKTGYRGPCPPVGRHRYFHKLYALDRVLGNLHGPSKQEVEQAMHGHVIGRAELVGTYRRDG